MIARWIWLALFCLIAPLAARAQSSPNWPYRYVPSPQEWNSVLADKVDTNNGSATNLTVTGGTLNGTITGPDGSSWTAAGLSSPTSLSMTGGTLSVTGSHTWTGSSFPGAGNLGVYENLSFTGTPTAGQGGAEGTSVPLNLIYDNDELNLSSFNPGGGAALEIQHVYGRGSMNGARNSLLLEALPQGTLGTSNTDYTALQVFMSNGANVSGATSSSPLGDFFGMGINRQISSGSYEYGSTDMELDFNAQSGAVSKYMEFAKFVVTSTNAFHAASNSAFLRFETGNPSTQDQLDDGLYFGDPQATSGGFPISSTGTLIYSVAGTAAVGIDLSNPTFTTALMKGPNSFQIDNSNRVHTASIEPPSGTTSFDIYGTNISPWFVASGDASTANYIRVVAQDSSDPLIESVGTGSPNLDIQTESNSGGAIYLRNSNSQSAFEALNVNGETSWVTATGASGNPSLTVGGTAANLQLGSGPVATTATTGFLMVPGMAGTPTGSVSGASANEPAIIIDTTDNKFCWTSGGGTFKCVSGS